MRVREKSEMKDSGVEWIGEIPKEWETTSLNKIFDIKAGGDLKKEYYSDVKTDEHQYPIYTNTVTSNEPYGYTKTPFFDENTITVTGRGDVGYAIYRDRKYDAIIRLLVLIPRKNDNCEYYEYFINNVLDFNVGSSAIGQLSTKQIAPYLVCYPSLKVRSNISNYLLRKSNKIDFVIEKQTELIEKLKEYKQSIITEAVTKGLDKDVPMKDSGVEWIGDVPEGWRVAPLKSVSFYQEGPGIMSNDFKDHGIPLIRISGMKKDKVSLDGCNYLCETKVDKKWNHFRLDKEDLLISASASTGLVAQVDNDTIGAIPYTGLIRFKPTYLLYNKYLKYFLLSNSYIEQINVQKTGTSIQHYGPSHLATIKLALPTVENQKDIANYLDNKTTQINKAIEDKQKIIDKLTEYKKSLIYEVVTGKVEV